ncbi:phage tail tape measure protein [Deinococcus cavernae]|uniref:Phage tail tape measure protein n=1 Tax=Deinococcus cavernae TaxID=2320857 RepID=A0A418VFK8_9DEIO|nr:phage tail tape measure protein [Deinococcus cavernae]RJF74915.1 phage tail tape measure protein [Deinococcus cavernae]
MTTVGTARFIITGDHAQALQAVQQVAQIARKQLEGLKVTPTFTGFQAELKRQIQAVQAQVAVTLKPVNQKQVDTALQKLQDSKTVTVGVNLDVKGDVAQRVAEIKAKLAELRSTTQDVLKIDTSAVERVIADLKTQVADLRAIHSKIPTQQNPNLPGQGGGGGGPPNPLQGLRNDLKAGSIDLQGFEGALARLQTTLRGDIAALQSLGVLTQQESRHAAQLTAALASVNAEINKNSITKLRGDLAGARTAFEQAIGAAGRFNFTGQRQATQAYEAQLAQLQARIRSVGAQAGITQADLRGLNGLTQQLASQRNAINGLFSPVGFSGGIVNALKSLPQFAAQMGGSLGAAFSGVTQLSGGLGGLAAAAGPVGIAIGAVVTALAGLATGLSKAIAQAEEFQVGMGKISTLTDKFPQQLGDVGQGILKMSADLGKSQTDLQNGMYDILGAGVKGTESMSQALGLLQTSAKLAVAGATDTKTATDVLTSSLNAYGLGADKANAASNKLFQAVLDGKMEFGQLAQSLGMVTPLAAQAGVSFDEVLAALAAMTKQGIKPATAVEYLRSALTNIVKPSEQAAGQAKAIGLQFDAAALKSKGFTAFMQDLMAKSKGNSAVLARLIGDVGGLTAVMALGSGGMKSYTDILGKVENATNTTDVAYQKATNNARHSQEQLSASWKVLLTVVGTPFLEAKKNIIDFTTSVVRNLTDIIQTGRGVPASFLLWRDTVQTAVAPLAGFIKDAFNVIAVAWNSVLKPVLTALWQIWLVIQTAVVTALGVVLNVVRGAISGIAGFVGGWSAASPEAARA